MDPITYQNSIKNHLEKKGFKPKILPFFSQIPKWNYLSLSLFYSLIFILLFISNEISSNNAQIYLLIFLILCCGYLWNNSRTNFQHFFKKSSTTRKLHNILVEFNSEKYTQFDAKIAKLVIFVPYLEYPKKLGRISQKSSFHISFVMLFLCLIIHIFTIFTDSEVDISMIFYLISLMCLLLSINNRFWTNKFEYSENAERLAYDLLSRLKDSYRSKWLNLEVIFTAPDAYFHSGYDSYHSFGQNEWQEIYFLNLQFSTYKFSKRSFLVPPNLSFLMFNQDFLNLIFFHHAHQLNLNVHASPTPSLFFSMKNKMTMWDIEKPWAEIGLRFPENKVMEKISPDFENYRANLGEKTVLLVENLIFSLEKHFTDEISL